VFTGIIEEIGEVVEVAPKGDSAVLTIAAERVAQDISEGASIAVNGVCLTVTGWFEYPPLHHVRIDVMGETLARSVLGALAPGATVNLERATRADSRLDGHVVQGHVDGTGTVLQRTAGSAWETVRFGLPAALARFVAEKGSIAVDGVSLTVTAVGPDWFEVGLIPQTLRATTLGDRPPGASVNLEVDVLAKYVARLLETAS
jgi:riboflavin synthase